MPSGVPDKTLVLLVDDQPANLRLLAEILRDDYLIATTTRGAEVMELASSERQPDLILLDVMMPDVNGLEVLGRLRANRRTNDIPVILVSADATEHTQYKGLDEGADDYLVKPIQPRVLLARVKNLLRRRQAEAAHAEVEAQLRESQKMEALGTLAGGVAHNLNNALAAILGNVELARQDVGPGHTALESLEEIGKASRRAKDLVQQILAFGRRQRLERQVASLAMTVVESARLIRASLPASVSLSVDCRGDTPAALADATQVKQLLLNLCNNAVQAVDGQARPGTIEVRLEAHTQREAHGGLGPGRYARLTVRDNGRGMDEATRVRIFEPFFTTKPVGKGTGLGLSVVHGIVKAHDAGIEVESTPGEGSVFRVYFPAVDMPGQAATAASPEEAAARGGGKKVLYVDDDEAIIFLMKRLLERQGFRVSGYTDPIEALAAARSDATQFDLVVTDYNMPGISGLEVAQALKAIRADLPVVLASGYITEELRAEASAAGIRELIYKPDTVGDLCEAVARVAREVDERSKVERKLDVDLPRP